MKRLWLRTLDWIITTFIVVFILGACALHNLWYDPLNDDNGGWE